MLHGTRTIHPGTIRPTDNSPTTNSPMKYCFLLKVKVRQQSENLEKELDNLFMKYIPSSKFNIVIVNNLT